MTDFFFWGSAAAVVVGGFVKGTLGFGFPVVATPLIALVPTAVVLCLFPNISMNFLQAISRPLQRENIRRLLPLIIAGVLGVPVGTQLLATLPGATLRLWLGVMVLAFVGLQFLPWKLSLPRSHWALWTAAIGAVSGVIGGMTNVFTPVVMFFYAIESDKAAFVQYTGAIFFVFQLTQVAATYHFELWTWSLAALVLPLTGVGLLGFWSGRTIHVRLPDRIFRRVVLLAIAVAGVALLFRSLGE
jgi:uncharacterized membrane protein YfcA